jgi:hypothetical protein
MMLIDMTAADVVWLVAIIVLVAASLRVLDDDN